VVTVLFNEGDQFPVIPSSDVVGRAVNAAPVQTGDTGVNTGMILFGLTVIVRVVSMAHCPVEGVNVYVVVAVLHNAGDQVPMIPLFEVQGRVASVAPVQIGDTGEKTGTILFGLTVIVSIVSIAHCPVAGVNVYVVVAVLHNTGDHVPLIPLFEVIGREAKGTPVQIGETGVKIGTVLFGFIIIVRVVLTAHCPVTGVNVYVVVIVLHNAGDHVPLIPLFDITGSAASVPPEQIGETGVKVGIVLFGVTVIVNVVVAAHCPAAGVNV